MVFRVPSFDSRVHPSLFITSIVRNVEGNGTPNFLSDHLASGCILFYPFYWISFVN